MKIKHYRWIGTLLFVMFLLLFVYAAQADGDCRGNQNCNGGGGDVVTDVATSMSTDVSIDNPVSVNSSISDSSRALGFGLGDVDINDCYRSFQVLVFQDSRANKWCMANDLDARGLYDAAARLRCSLKSYASIFPDHDTCVVSSTVRVSVPVVSEPHDDEDDDDRQTDMIMALQMEVEMLRDQFERTAARPAPVQRTVVEQKPLLTEDQKARLREIAK